MPFSKNCLGALHQFSPNFGEGMRDRIQFLIFVAKQVTSSAGTRAESGNRSSLHLNILTFVLRCHAALCQRSSWGRGAKSGAEVAPSENNSSLWVFMRMMEEESVDKVKRKGKENNLWVLQNSSSRNSWDLCLN